MSNQAPPSSIHYADIAKQLSDYCAAQHWSGYDPYDALNARLLKFIPFVERRLPRLLLTQLFKRSPLNLRPLAGVPQTENPKALALFVMAFLRLSNAGVEHPDGVVKHLVRRLTALRSPYTPQWSWGYSFPWQGRKHYVPRGFPNLVCTTFVANALLDAYDHTKNDEYLSMARGAANYICDELYWTAGSKSGFSYPLPHGRTSVHNANLLGAALLARVARASNEESLLEPSLRVARYSAAQQLADGAWNYGEDETQRWIDNFHTGYNLCALQSIAQFCETDEFATYLNKGFDFYLSNFIRDDGAPKYFSNRTYPIDIHSAAQTIITLVVCAHLHPRSLTIARTVLEWSVANMWDTRRHYFYYQASAHFTSKISYMRWSQAWMLLAISTVLERDARTDK